MSYRFEVQMYYCQSSITYSLNLYIYIYLYISSSLYLFFHKSLNHHDFPGIRINDPILCAEIVIEYHLKFYLELLILNMDMMKTVDIIDHPIIVLEQIDSFINMLYLEISQIDILHTLYYDLQVWNSLQNYL